MAALLAAIEVECQHCCVVGIADFSTDIGVGGEIPGRVEHCPGGDRLTW
jgi:hypothetical protein